VGGGDLALVSGLNVAQQIVFAALALAMVLSAVRMVTTRNLVHAALYLTIVLAGAAGLYILLAAEFVAITQVLVYIGAIVVLMLFGLFLTRAPLGGDQELDNNQRWLAGIIALFLFGVLGVCLQRGFKGIHVNPTLLTNGGSNTAAVGVSIFHDYVVPFEVASILLLAALVGAVVIARRD
jgi:NADH-quinone oxidoreductase subunit J